MAMIGGSNEAGPGGGVSAEAQGQGREHSPADLGFGLSADYGGMQGAGAPAPSGLFDTIGNFLSRPFEGFDFNKALNVWGGTSVATMNPVMGLLTGLLAGMWGKDRGYYQGYGEPGLPGSIGGVGPQDIEGRMVEQSGFGREDSHGREGEHWIDKLMGGGDDDDGFGSITPGPTSESTRREEGRRPAGLGLSGDLESTTKKYFKGTGSNLLSQGLVFDESEFTKKLF